MHINAGPDNEWSDYLMEVALTLSGQEVGVAGQRHVPRVDDVEVEASPGAQRQPTQPVAHRRNVAGVRAVDARHRQVETRPGGLHHHCHSVQLTTPFHIQNNSFQFIK